MRLDLIGGGHRATRLFLGSLTYDSPTTIQGSSLTEVGRIPAVMIKIWHLQEEQSCHLSVSFKLPYIVHKWKSNHFWSEGEFFDT